MKTNIEPGCLCIVTDPDSFGKPVEAIEVITGPVRICGVIGNPKTGRPRLWRISERISWTDPYGVEHFEPYCPENLLRRIDGHTEQAKDKEAVYE